MSDLVCVVTDEPFADIPVEHRAYVRWCADEFDPVNPYHDAWPEDGLDNYDTELGSRAVVRHFLLTCIAMMGDALRGPA